MDVQALKAARRSPKVAYYRTAAAAAAAWRRAVKASASTPDELATATDEELHATGLLFLDVNHQWRRNCAPGERVGGPYARGATEPYTAPAQPVAATDYRVVATLADRTTRVYASHPLNWDAAQRMWDALEGARVRGQMPHVAYYAVRATDDPAWQGLRLDQRVLAPPPVQPTPRYSTRVQQPTRHQADVLARLVRRSTGGHAPLRDAAGTLLRGELRWVKATSCGGPMALHHLEVKGYAELDVRTGPRGGEHVYYRPTEAGLAYAARQQVRRALQAAAQ